MTHGQLCTQVMLDWTAQKRGRLFPYRQGLVEQGGRTFKIGRKGVADLIGFEEFVYKKYDESEPFLVLLPIFCAVEVKTLKYPTLSKEQKAYLNYVKSINGRAYVAMEQDSDWQYPVMNKDKIIGGYDLEEWTEF
jgi:hypothetical protein